MNETKRNEMREAFGRHVVRETKSQLALQRLSVDELLELSHEVQTEKDLNQLCRKFRNLTCHNKRAEKNYEDYTKVQEVLTETLKKGDIVTVMGISDYLKKNRIVFNQYIHGRPQIISLVLNEWVEKGLAKKVGIISNYWSKTGGYTKGYKML